MYEQRVKLDSTGFAWQRTGAVMSKSISVKTGGQTVETGLTDIKADTRGTWSVKVNGVGYNVVTSPTQELKKDDVRIDETGNLTFGKALDADSTVKIDYIADSRTDTVSIPTVGDTLKLNKGAIDAVNSITIKKATDGIVDENATIDLILGAQDNDTKLFSMIDVKDNTKVYGYLNKETGQITLNENVDRPVKDSKTTISLEVNYDHLYTTFSMDTSTSKGERQDTFLVSASDSLNSVINQVNGASVGVNMFYDSATGQMTMTRNETGDFNNNPETNDTKYSGSFINAFLKFQGAEAKVKGQNALFTINGLENASYFKYV